MSSRHRQKCFWQCSTSIISKATRKLCCRRELPPEARHLYRKQWIETTLKLFWNYNWKRIFCINRFKKKFVLFIFYYVSVRQTKLTSLRSTCAQFYILRRTFLFDLCRYYDNWQATVCSTTVDRWTDDWSRRCDHHPHHHHHHHSYLQQQQRLFTMTRGKRHAVHWTTIRRETFDLQWWRSTEAEQVITMKRHFSLDEVKGLLL